jgi:hypothetical protein
MTRHPLALCRSQEPRLRCDRLDLADRVVNGELSFNAAARKFF